MTKLQFCNDLHITVKKYNVLIGLGLITKKRVPELSTLEKRDIRDAIEDDRFRSKNNHKAIERVLCPEAQSRIDESNLAGRKWVAAREREVKENGGNPVNYAPPCSMPSVLTVKSTIST